jgi:hypothetical protein
MGFCPWWQDRLNGEDWILPWIDFETSVLKKSALRFFSHPIG